MNTEDELKTLIVDLVNKTKSTAEFFWPEWANSLFDNITAGQYWVMPLPLTGPNQLTFRARFVNTSHIEIEITVSSGERIGLINMRRDR